ncbi:MAG: hypothetical protein ACREHD_11685, partial [Pirellulales bacterium]
NALFCGAWFGAAQVSKYVWICLYPAWPLIWLGWRFAQRTRGQPVSLRRECLQMAAMVLCGLFLTNAAYLFEGSFSRVDTYNFGARPLAEMDARAARWLAAVPVPLPAPYVRGIDEIGAWFDRPHQSYLRGEWGDKGWWYYYLYGLAVKLPLGTWLIVLAAATLWSRDRRCRLSPADDAFLLLPVVLVLSFITFSSAYQSHIRYAMPVLPFVFVWASRIAPSSLVRPRIGVFTGAALFWSAASALTAYPHCIAYFNELAGGMCNGDKHLIDSNIDWGQDLYELQAWLARHPEARPFHLAYFGGVDPRLAGIEFTLPPKSPPDKGARAASGRIKEEGWYAISVNYLHGLPFSAPDGQGRWRPIAPGQYSYFRGCEPVGRAGYSIRIYHGAPKR